MKLSRIINLRQPAGSSLIDVVVATVLTAAVLVPSTRVLRQSISTSKNLEVKHELLVRCESLLETELQSVSQGKSLRTTRGRIATDAGRLNYELVASDRTALGGIPGQLIGVSATVWLDTVPNNRRDSQESYVCLYSKISAP